MKEPIAGSVVAERHTPCFVLRMDPIDASFWSSGASAALRTALTAALAYAGIVAVLRISGKRTVAKLSAFDLVVTVALGSTLATIALSPRTPLFDGLVGAATLVVLQWIASFATSRSRAAAHALKSSPRVVARRGRLVEEALRAENLEAGEVFAAVRRHGRASLQDVRAVVLESDGSLSVIGSTDAGDDALRDVVGWPSRDAPSAGVRQVVEHA